MRLGGRRFTCTKDLAFVNAESWGSAVPQEITHNKKLDVEKGARAHLLRFLEAHEAPDGAGEVA